MADAAAEQPIADHLSAVSPPGGAQTLLDLATRGSWRAVADQVARARSQHLLRLPHHHLAYLAFNLLALLKLRRFPDAAAELAALDPDDLDAPAYRYESHPGHYPPPLAGSMVPFALRLLHAAIPLHLPNRRRDGLDRLYSLLAHVRSKLLHPETADSWRLRESFLINFIAGVHLAGKEFDVCLQHLSELLRRRPSDPNLLSKVGLVHLQLGDIDRAKIAFALAAGGAGEDSNLAGRNHALVHMVEKDYAAAAREYDGCIERDGADVVAINNKALCLLYLRDLSDSIKGLEGALERAPTKVLNETLVVNLCSMYELAFVNNSEIKKTLSNWIAQVAPDDFDASCTRA